MEGFMRRSGRSASNDAVSCEQKGKGVNSALGSCSQLPGSSDHRKAVLPASCGVLREAITKQNRFGPDLKNTGNYEVSPSSDLLTGQGLMLPTLALLSQS